MVDTSSDVVRHVVRVRPARTGNASNGCARGARRPLGVALGRRAGPVRRLALVVALLLASASSASGQDVPGDVGGFTRLGSFPTFLPFEHLDTQNVQVILRFTAFVLPGNRGRDLVIEYVPGDRWGIARVPVSVQDGIYIPATTPIAMRPDSTF